MRRRSGKFWLWSNTRLSVHTHEEVLDQGVRVEVYVRVNHEGVTQAFIGVYSAEGGTLGEETYDRREPCHSVMKWAAQRARQMVIDSHPFIAPHRVQPALGPMFADETLLVLRQMDMSERERLKLKSEDAWAEYLAAKSAMLALMRSAKVDPQTWTAHKERLRQAIDRRACVQRAYLT